MPGSIRWRLSLGYVGLILLVTLILGFYIVRQSEDDYLEQLRADLLRQAGMASAALAPHLDDRQELQRQVRKMAEAGKIRITVVDFNGTVLADSETDPAGMENLRFRPEIKGALDEGSGWTGSTRNPGLLYVASYYEPEQVVLRLAVPPDRIELSLAELRRTIITAVLLAGLAGLVLALWFAAGITRPLEDLTLAAARIARGDLNKRVLPRGKDEIAVLGRTVNHMADSLEEKVRELTWAKSRLESILNNMDSGVIVFNRAGRVELTNPTFRSLFGLKESEIMGRRALEIIRDARFQQLLELSSREGEKAQMEMVMGQAGSEKILEVFYAPIKRNGGYEGTLVVFHEITQLRRLERIRSEFVANVSHELRTPMTSVKGYAETLLDGALEDPKISRKFVGIINDEAERLTRLINDLLDLSRLESQAVVMRLAPVNPGKAVDNCLARLAPIYHAREIKVTSEVPEHLPPVWADWDWLQQVLGNLVDNAVKYNQVGGEVVVRATPENGGVRFEVQDTGPGIPRESLDRIFERFYRVEKARSRKMGGTGLGLAIVKHVVESHGGRLGVDSTPGLGSTFWFWLPAAPG